MTTATATKIKHSVVSKDILTEAGYHQVIETLENASELQAFVEKLFALVDQQWHDIVGAKANMRRNLRRI
jgi:hypothetical protein